MILEKFLVRRNLGLYGEMKFAEILKKRGFEPFFPYRDRGIDIIAIMFYKNHRTFFTYQVKSRNINKNKSFGDYWFRLKEKDLKKNQAQYWVFAIFKENNRFDFLRIPFKTIDKWVKQSCQNKEKNILSPEPDGWSFKVKRVENSYISIPMKGSVKLDKYIFK